APDQPTLTGMGVYLLASDGKTLAAYTHNGKALVLQIWTRDGKKMLREEPVQPVAWLNYEPAERLVSLGSGYLLSSQELLWGPAAAAAPVRRFAPARDTAIDRVNNGPRTNEFGTPVVNDRHVVVTGLDGGIYVFDADKIFRR